MRRDPLKQSQDFNTEDTENRERARRNPATVQTGAPR